MSEGNADPQPERDRGRQITESPPTFDTGALLGSHREVILVHKGAQYRLRVTQSGKLILTK